VITPYRHPDSLADKAGGPFPSTGDQVNLVLSLQGLDIETPDVKLDLDAAACSCCTWRTSGSTDQVEHGRPAEARAGVRVVRVTPLSHTESNDYICSSEQRVTFE
jgi:hypothetical protein